MTTREMAAIPIWDKVTTIEDLKSEPVRWAVPHMLPRESVVLVAGSFASYKSWLALDWCFAVATGTEWAGVDIQEPLPVLYFDRENNASTIAARRDMLLEDRGPLKRRFTYWGDWVRLPVPEVDGEAMMEWAAMNNGLIVYDTLTRFHRSRENDNMAMAGVMEKFLKLARAGATVVILHHRGKSQEAQFRGAEDIVGSVDVAYSLTRNDDERSRVTLKQIKNRCAPESTAELVLVHGRFQQALVGQGRL